MTKQMETMVPLQNSKENNPPGDRANRTVRWLIAASFAFLMAIGSVAAIPSLTFARQLPPPELPMKPAQSPIDGGLALLAAAGGGYAIKKLRDKRRSEEHTSELQSR